MPEPAANLNPLRKAAILIAALDASSADRVLDQMTEEQARAVRDQVLELDEIDPELQRSVLQEFFAAQQPTEKTTSVLTVVKTPAATSQASGVELDLSSHAEPATKAYAAMWNHRDDTTNPLSFLAEVEPTTLAEYLLREHPQTLAVVLAHLPPRRAAAVLERLPLPHQAEVARRIVELDDMDPTVIQELATSFAQLVDEQLRKQRRRTTGMNRLAGILAESCDTAEQQILHNLAQYQQELSQGIRLARTPATSRIAHVPDASQTEGKHILPFPRTSESPPAQAFARVLELSDTNLLAVLQHAETEQVVLALASVEAHVIDRIARRLPNAQARLLQRALRELGPTRSEQVAAAQRELELVAEQLGHLKSMSRRLQAA